MEHFRKNSYRGWGLGHGISQGIEQRTCGNSTVELKKKWNFQGCRTKNLVISMGLAFQPLNFQGVPHNFSYFAGVKSSRCV